MYLKPEPAQIQAPVVTRVEHDDDFRYIKIHYDVVTNNIAAAPGKVPCRPYLLVQSSRCPPIRKYGACLYTSGVQNQDGDCLMRLLTTLTLLTVCLNAIGQTFLFTESRYTASKYTESTYTDSTGRVVIIQSSLPKGGGGYTDPTGKEFAYVIFWTRVINETTSPLELTINFPADSFATLASSDSYLKVFLPRDTMTVDKVLLYDYGITDLKSFLDTGFSKSTTLQRTINSKEECLFYIGALLHQASGPVRAELVAKEQDLFYKINLLGSNLIPCGHIVSKR